MNKKARNFIIGLAVGLILGAVTYIVTAQETDAEIWLIVDGTAIGTVKPGTMYYDLNDGAIYVESNELIYGCSQARIFRDRFQPNP